LPLKFKKRKKSHYEALIIAINLIYIEKFEFEGQYFTLVLIEIN